MNESLKNTLASPLEKRTWYYLQAPRVFDMAACACGNSQPQWSEFVKHLWCEKCQVDFIPQHGGIFDGPIPSKVAALMGIRFDRRNLLTGNIERFDLETSSYIVSET